jgi:hypothetical protein
MLTRAWGELDQFFSLKFRTQRDCENYEFVPSFQGFAEMSPDGKLKALEYDGYLFEAATAALNWVVLKELGKFTPFLNWIIRIIGERSTPTGIWRPLW